MVDDRIALDWSNLVGNMPTTEQDDLVLAYALGQLPDHVAQVIARQIDDDPELAAQVNVLQAMMGDELTLLPEPDAAAPTPKLQGTTASLLEIPIAAQPNRGDVAHEAKIGYLIDMDGVIYRGNELIPGADRFINELRTNDIPFSFLTNNSQRTRRDVVVKLQRLGIEVEESHVFTCAMATARYLARQKPGGTAYVIGEGGLLNALHANGYSIVDKDPDYVVVGEGRTLNFEMVEHAQRMILGGAKLVATNLDPNCPTAHGPRPGCGAIVAMLEAAAGVKAFSVGKPSPVMLRMARKELGLRTDQTIVIGDTMETDILGGVQLGFKTILVLSGGTSLGDLPRYAYGPDKIVGSIADLSHTALACEYISESSGFQTPASRTVGVGASSVKRLSGRRKKV